MIIKDEIKEIFQINFRLCIQDIPLNIKLLKSVFNLKSLGFERSYRKYKLSLFCKGGRGVCAFKNVPIFFVPISEGGEG